MCAYWTALALTLLVSACVTSSPLAGLTDTTPTVSATEVDAILASALRYAIANPETEMFVALAAPERVPIASVYHVLDGVQWEPRPLPASALPAGTGKRFVLVSDDEAYARASTHGEFSWVTLTFRGVVGDTATVGVGRRTFYSSPGEQRPGLRPGFGASGHSQLGQFVRSGSSWEFDQWTGSIGS